MLIFHFNGLLSEHEFPQNWKTAKLVFIPKATKAANELYKYGPICLLHPYSKLYEGLIRNRLLKELESRENLSENQYGFTKRRSTIQAVEKVKCQKTWKHVDDSCNLRRKNAYNTAIEADIIAEMEETIST